MDACPCALASPHSVERFPYSAVGVSDFDVNLNRIKDFASYLTEKFKDDTTPCNT